MKKSISILLALVTVIGLFAAGAVFASAEDLSESMNIYANAGTLASDSLSISWTSGNITFTNYKTSGSSAIRTSDSDHYRIYKNSKVTIACAAGNITKIEVTCTSSDYATVLQGSVQSGTATVSGKVVTITPATTVSSTYSIETMGGQSRVSSITVYYVAATCAHSNTTSTTTDATCTANGITTVACSDCGETISTTVAASFTGHSFADGVCANCGISENDVARFQQLTAVDADADGYMDDVTEGYYVMGGPKSGEYPIMNLATNAIITNSSNKDLSVTNTYALVVDNIITEDLFADDVQVFEFNGDNTNGFTISYTNDTEVLYLGYTDITTNRRLAFSADHSDIRWTVKLNSAGNTYLCTTDGTNYYVVYYNAGDIRSYNSESKLYNTLYLFKYVGGGSNCYHQWSDWTVTTAPTCTAEGEQSRTCGLCSEVQTDAVSATGHSYIFGDEAATCENCDLNVAKSNIADLRSFTDANQLYYFEGVVTYASGTDTRMEDSTGGICVFYASGEQNVSIGDTIRVIDTLTTYNGLIEASNTMASETYKVSSGAKVTSQAADIATLKAATDNSFLSEKVTLTGLKVTAVDTSKLSSKKVTYTLSDGTNEIQIYQAYAPTADVVIPAGATVNVDAIVSIYKSTYQLVVQDHSWIEQTGWFNNAAVCEAGKIVATYATLDEAYTAYTVGTQYIQILNDIEDGALQLTKDLYVDLNGRYLYLDVTVGEYTIYGMDSATEGYVASEGYLELYDLEEGSPITTGVASSVADQAGGTHSYLAVGEDGTWSFHPYEIKLTHVSLDPTKDALGYKAQFFGDPTVCSMVTGFGFNLGVEGGQTKTYTKSYDAENVITSGQVLTLRLKNIMAADGGERNIIASALVTFGEQNVTSAEHTTSMKDTILAVNKIWADLTDAQKTAVQTLYNNYSQVMGNWITEAGVTNNIAPVVEDTTTDEGTTDTGSTDAGTAA